MAKIQVVETVVLENGVFVPCREQAVLTKIGENSELAFYPTPAIDEITKMKGCHPDKMTVCQKHRFDNLEKYGTPARTNYGCYTNLAAQCEIPPHIAQYPFEIVSQRGVSHPFALFS